MNHTTHFEAQQLGCIRQGRWLFSEVSFSLKAGELLLVEGANGAGKSSLLRLLAGIASPASGNILFQQQSIQDCLQDYKEELHYIGHTNGIRLGLTVTENLTLAAELSQQHISNMSDALSMLQLDQQKNTQTQYLSAGQKRRTALARLFLIPRKLWILDEPLTSLDAATQKILLTKIESHLTNGGMCVMTSHQPVNLNAEIKHLRLTSC
ncbi:MAG TPA: cytochrome c biogenesis heme-transporting ATPase CcmA [Gammaproteobacteria bacterium]|nr:cytochrome c biogenesis heme-transporting ATPase CcmA [Gammaproteobacteria bacterium]